VVYNEGTYFSKINKPFLKSLILNPCNKTGSMLELSALSNQTGLPCLFYSSLNNLKMQLFLSYTVVLNDNQIAVTDL